MDIGSHQYKIILKGVPMTEQDTSDLALAYKTLRERINHIEGNIIESSWVGKLKANKIAKILTKQLLSDDYGTLAEADKIVKRS